MTVSAEQLRELHRMHRQLEDLNDQLARGPRQIKAAQANAQRAEQEHAEAKEAQKRTRMAYDEKQLYLRQREAKIEDLQRKLNECKSNTEFKTLKDQIAAEKQANSVLEDEILEKLERLDELEVELKADEAKLVKTHDDLKASEQRVQGRLATLEAELARVTEGLSQAEAALPSEFRTDYQRLVRGRGEQGLAPVDGECCGGCNTVLSPQTMNELYLSKPVFCKSCGCMLYLAEDRSVGTS